MIHFFTENYENLKESLTSSLVEIPKWFKKQPSSCPVTHKFSAEGTKNFLTIKHCPGILDYLKHGYVLKMWEDIEISVKENYLLDSVHKIDDFSEVTGWPYLSKTENTKFKIHHLSQFLDLPIRKNHNHAIKLLNPWQAKSTSNREKLLVLPLILEDLPFQIIPGIIEISFYHFLHIPMLINSDKPFTIKKGTPLLQYIPLVDNIDVNISSIDSIDQSTLTNWTGGSKAYKKLRSN